MDAIYRIEERACGKWRQSKFGPPLTLEQAREFIQGCNEHGECGPMRIRNIQTNELVKD